MNSSKMLAVLLVSLLATLCPEAITAVEFLAGDHVELAADEVIEDDLYVTGETIVVDGTVRGDLVAAGRQVTLTGRVDGDLLAAGQVVVISGTVVDDARIAGMVLELKSTGQVRGHIVSAGYSFEAEPGSRVGESMVFSGAKARLAGDLEGDLRVAASAVEIGGTVAGNVDAQISGEPGTSLWFERFFSTPVEIPDVAGGLTVSESAYISGRLEYVSPSEGPVPTARIDGGVEWKPTRLEEDPALAESEPPSLISRVGSQLRRFAALALFGLLLLWRAPAWTEARVESLCSTPLRSFGWGLAGYLGVSLGVLGILAGTITLAILFGTLTLGRWVTLVILLGLFLLVAVLVAFFVAVLFGAPIVVSGAFGRTIVQRARTATSNPYLTLLLGILLFVLVTGLPYVGRVVGWLVLILGLGPLTQWLWTTRRRSTVADGSGTPAPRVS